jgi:hypothetical protein
MTTGAGTETTLQRSQPHSGFSIHSGWDNRLQRIHGDFAASVEEIKINPGQHSE